MTTQSPATPEGAFHFQLLAEKDPELRDLAQKVRQHVMGDRALPAKTKILMAMLCDAIRDRQEQVRGIAGIARRMGATEEEILETLEVAYWIGGVHALQTASQAFREER